MPLEARTEPDSDRMAPDTTRGRKTAPGASSGHHGGLSMTDHAPQDCPYWGARFEPDGHAVTCPAVLARPDPFAGPVEENERGGRQSSSPYFFRGLPPLAIRRIARVLKLGAAGDGTPEHPGYEADPFGDVRARNWHKISSDEHLEH